jgi:hypothetical protein
LNDKYFNYLPCKLIKRKPERNRKLFLVFLRFNFSKLFLTNLIIQMYIFSNYFSTKKLKTFSFFVKRKINKCKFFKQWKKIFF